MLWKFRRTSNVLFDHGSKLITTIARPRKIAGHKFSALNFLTTKCMDVPAKSSIPDTYELDKFRGQLLTYTTACPPDYLGWSGYQLLAGSMPLRYRSWVKRPLERGCLLLIPNGNLPFDQILYRGAGIFACDAQISMLAFPQLAVEEIGSVDRTIYGLGGAKYRLGWKVLRITEAEAISTPATCLDGWINSGECLHFKYNSTSPVLQIISDQPLSSVWSVHGSDGRSCDLIPEHDGTKIIMDIELSGKHAQRSWIEFNSRGIGQDTRMHLARVGFTSRRQHNLTLCKTPDHWLVNETAIAYPSTLASRVLYIKTDGDVADTLRIDGMQSSSSKCTNGLVAIPLVGGRPTADGRLSLVLSSPNFLRYKNDPRQLLMRTNGHYLR